MFDKKAYVDAQIEAHRESYKREHEKSCVEFVKSLVERVGRAEVLLDMGCYNGLEARFLCKVADRVVGIDLGEEYIKAAKDRGIPNFQPLVMDMHELLFEDESFDVVFANNIIEHSHSPSIVFQEIHRVLRPGGRLIYAIPPDKLRSEEVYFEGYDYHLWIASPIDIHKEIGKWFDQYTVEVKKLPQLTLINSDWYMVMGEAIKGK
jgi:SAM-dependent methyltransferase